MEIKSVLIIEDHPLTAEGYKSIIHSNFSDVFFSFSTTASDALERLEHFMYDLIITDVFLPDNSDCTLIKKIQERFPTQKILVITQGNNYSLIQEIIQRRVDGLVLKESKSSDIIDAIKQILAGSTFYSKKAQIIALDANPISSNDREHFHSEPTSRSVKQTRLSITQYMVIQFISEGLSNKEIAKEMELSEPAVEDYCNTIFKNYGVNNKTELKEYVAKHGVLN